MLTLDSLEELLGPKGQEALSLAIERRPSPATLLADLEALRGPYGPVLASAAVEIAMLRARAEAKFSRAPEMYFTREALEQATTEAVARHRATRYQDCAAIVDLCCGIGGDLVQLAGLGSVAGVDLDPLRLRMARLNAAAYGVADRVTLHQADVGTWEPPAGAALFFDPARRLEGRRVFEPERYQPSLGLIDRWLGRSDGIGVKVAPGIDYDALPWEHREVEVVSLGGEVKEAVLWFGRFVRAERSATVLPAGATLSASAVEPIPSTAPRRYLYEPDGAVIRAHLVEHLAAELGATKIDDKIAFLSGDEQRVTPFARSFRVDDVLPFNLKRLRQYLRERSIGRVVVKKRGSPIDPQVFEQQLRARGDRSAVIVLTRVLGKPATLICDERD
ncbi:MAG: FIG00945369: hypothetical protein [uncultured Chloroflexia bacterium]|uniref:THUMP-like domain-containing protein n=1 Tax=uncultured Chloroflexia bacterium TaxID=1672391 RepID=A0A6J4H2M4_9CHLR|nr:MAG: FIG00945369: hypothetical protein [uncultured Chloroflexia bacterium]